MQSVPITTNVVGSIHAHGEVYSIQHYVMKFVSDLPAGRWLSPETPVSSTNKTYRHDIAVILLKVALNTITLPPLVFQIPEIAIINCFLNILNISVYDEC